MIQKRLLPQTVEASIFFSIPSTTYQHMRPLLRKESVSIYLHTCFGAATQEGFSIDSTRTASQLYAALCKLSKICTRSVIVFINFFNFNHIFSTCQQFSIIFAGKMVLPVSMTIDTSLHLLLHPESPVSFFHVNKSHSVCSYYI
ncbi:hypothetical protein AMURIS_05180 [Acetatifactor muris]|uniref:Uncharacterized protein n=1 Tax=Acetatifactor muris TaxID=879566 RepID=A0A2K4ZPL8_9FIRM|nr:hypothetical protein AMURIS_05180 [Acetatifactor muris]